MAKTLSFAEANRAKETRRKAQLPYRKQFDKTASLADVAKLVTTPDMPWLAWVIQGRYGDDGDISWTGFADRKQVPAIRKQLVKLLEKLIDQGNYDVESALGTGYHVLAELLRCEELEPKQRLALLVRALDRGADPTTRIVRPQWKSPDGPGFVAINASSALDFALYEDNKPALAKILPHAKPDALADAYLRLAISQLSSQFAPEWVTVLDRAGDLERVVEKLDDVDIGALIHFACGADVAPEYLEALASRVKLTQPLATEMTFSVGTGSVKLKKGATPRDIVEGTLGQIGRDEKKKRTPDLATMRAAAEKKLELLSRTKRSKAVKPTLPPAIAAVYEQVLRLAKLLGTPTAPIEAAIATIDDDGLGPWSFLHEMVSQFDLMPPKAAARDLFEMLTVHTTKAWIKTIPLDELPPAQAKLVEAAVRFDKNLLAIKLRDGKGTPIWKLDKKKVTVVAKTVGDYLSSAIDRYDK